MSIYLFQVNMFCDRQFQRLNGLVLQTTLETVLVRQALKFKVAVEHS